MYEDLEIVAYKHHSQTVYVRRDLKGEHRSYSLCYQCAKFHPQTPENCEIAQATFEHDMKYHITTPVFECPEFVQN